MKQPLLTIENLSIDFINDNHVTHALENVSFTINKGEVVAVVGESGSGKSVTALSILQLLSSSPAIYTNGKILFHNNEAEMNILKLSSREMQDIRGNLIGMIFQEPMTSLNPVLNCGTQVSEAIILHKKLSSEKAKQQTLSLFKEVRLPEVEKIYNRYPHQLSGGQKQRVMIAMAMSCNPQLLICDEPTTALDVTVQKNILLLIRTLQQQHNMSVIFISHDLGVVSEIADKIIVMYKGKIVEQGTTNDILYHPQHPYTKALLACRPALHSKGERLPVISDFMNDSKQTIGNRQCAIANMQSGSNEQSEIVNLQSETIIKVESLKVWYPSQKTFLGKILSYTKAVNDVSFEIYKSETLGLVGESGCGKTTLGRALLALIEPTEGKIF